MSLTRLVKAGFPVVHMPTVETLADLRKSTPDTDGELVVVRRSVTGGPVLNVPVFYDATDTTTPDNGYSVFVTASGARYKDDPAEPINVALYGYTAALNNMAECITAVNAAEVARLVARGSVAGGVRQLEVPHLPVFATAAGESVFTMRSTVRTAAVIPVLLPHQASFEWADFTTGTGWVCSNEYTGLVQSLMFKDNGGMTQGASAGHNCIAIHGRGSIFRGPGYDKTTYPALRVGNVTYPSQFAHCRDVDIDDIRLAGWGDGLRLGYVDTYLLRFNRLMISRNTYGLRTTTNGTQWTNSGENIRFNQCVIGDNYSAGIFRNDKGHLITYTGCSLDYNVGDLFLYGDGHIGKDTVVGGHYEGVGGLIANHPAQTSSDGQINLTFQNVEYFGYRTVGDAYAGIRNLVYGVSNRLNVEWRSSNWFAKAPYVNNAYGMVKDLSDSTNQARVLVQYPLAGQSYRYMPSIDYRINSTFTLTGTAGASLPTSKAGGTFFAIRTGAATAVYGSASDADADGYIPVLITATAATDTCTLLYNRPLYFGRDLKQLFGKCSIKVGSATGAVNMQTCARVIQDVTRTANTTTGVITEVENLASIPTSVTQDMINSLSKPTITITADDYMSTYPAPCSLVGGQYAYMGLRFTGFVGTIAVKLPLWWFPDEHPTSGYL